MSSNPFKTFIPYSITPPDVDAWNEARSVTHMASDPTGGQWSTLGLAEPFDKQGLVSDLQGAGHLMAVRFNERILPAKVRNEHVAKAIARLEKTQGHKASKKDYAQLIDQAEFELLPKAFIRRTLVPVLFCKDVMLICTSSAKRADDVTHKMIEVFGMRLAPRQMQTAHPLVGILTTAAISGELSAFDSDTTFYSGKHALLKGEGKKTIRIAAKELQDADVHDLVKQTDQYAVHELGMWLGGDEQSPNLTFIVNAGLMFKAAEMPNIKAKMMKDDMHAFAVLCVQTYPALVLEFVATCGGLKASSDPTDEDDDDF